MAVVSNTCNGSLGDYCKVYLKYVINSQDIENNKSNITLTLYAQATSTSVGAYNLNGNASANIKIDGTTKKSSSTLDMDFRNKAKVDMITWTGDVEHDDEGKLTITISGNFDTNGPSSVTTGSVSKKWTLTTIKRASSVTCADGNIGSATTINISRASSSFTHTLTYEFEGLTGTIATKTSSTSIGWTIPTSFYEKIPNATYGTCTIHCTTYSGSTKIGDTQNCTFKASVFVEDNRPEITATVIDVNEKTVALTGDADKLIKYFSNAQVDLTATAKNSATIASQKVVCGNLSSSEASSVLEGVESGTFEISCKDSRKISSDADPVVKEMIEYIKLAFTDIKLSRPSTTSNTINCSLKGNYFNQSFGQVDNTLNLKYRYIVSGGEWEENYIELTPTIDGNTFTYEASLGDVFDFNKGYEFEFVAEDKLMPATEPVPVTRGIPIIDIGEEDIVINIPVYEEENKVLSARIGDVIITSTNVNPSEKYGGTWKLVDKEFKSGYGTSAFSENSNNVSSSDSYWIRGGHTVSIRLTTTTAVAISDTATLLGTFDFETIGVSTLVATPRFVGWSDDANGVFPMDINYSSGLVRTLDFVGGDTAAAAAGITIQAYITVAIPYNFMLDSACDKFYWQRTA